MSFTAASTLVDGRGVDTALQEPEPTAELTADAKGAVHFATVAALLLELLANGAAGSRLAPVLVQVIGFLRKRDMRLERRGNQLECNGHHVAPQVARIWCSHMEQQGITCIDVHRDAAETELLHFLALLAGAPGDVPFTQLWLERGAWRVHADRSLGAPPLIPTTESSAAATLLHELITPQGTLHHDPTDDELDRLSALVTDGESAAPDSELGMALRMAGSRAVQALLVRLSNAASGSQRRALYQTLASLNTGHEYLVLMLSHPRWFVVRNAVSLIGDLGVLSAEGHLGVLLRHEDARVRTACVTAAGKLGTPLAMKVLEEGTHDRSGDVRQAAWLAWQHCDTPPSAPHISDALREEPHVDAQRAILECMARFPELDVANALVRFCAHGAASASPLELLTLGVDLLAKRKPQSARQFVRYLADSTGQ